MKCSLGISNSLEETSSLSHSIVFLYFFVKTPSGSIKNRPGQGKYQLGDQFGVGGKKRVGSGLVLEGLKISAI